MCFCLCEGVFALAVQFLSYQIGSFPGRTLAEVLAASEEMDKEAIGVGDEAARGRGVQPPDGCGQELPIGEGDQVTRGRSVQPPMDARPRMGGSGGRLPTGG
jgi:hypothetical protein